MSFPSKRSSAVAAKPRYQGYLSSLQGLNSSGRLVAVPHQCFECDSPAQPDASTGVLQTMGKMRIIWHTRHKSWNAEFN